MAVRGEPPLGPWMEHHRQSAALPAVRLDKELLDTVMAIEVCCGQRRAQVLVVAEHICPRVDERLDHLVVARPAGELCGSGTCVVGGIGGGVGAEEERDAGEVPPT